VDGALENLNQGKDVDYEVHLGGNVYLSLTSPYNCVDIRQKYQDERGVIRFTRRGVSLRRSEWLKLKQAFGDILGAVPEADDLPTPCLMRDDHMNPLGALECKECTPNGYRY
jgi:hypothetical protein